MKNFTVQIDTETDNLLNQMKKALHKTSRAEVFRSAIALLKIAVEAENKNERLVVANSRGKVVKEIWILR